MRRWWPLLLYFAAIIVVVIQRLEPDRHAVFTIYRESFFDLLAHRSLYASHPGRLDYFRYSPTFALLFGPFALIPWQLGVMLWTALNALALYAVIGALLPARQALLVRLIVLGDLVRSLQNCQSNGLVAAAIVAAFVAWERRQALRGAWSVTAGAAIKIFPMAAGLFALVRPERRRNLSTIAVAGAALLLLPALFVGPASLLQQYGWWFTHEKTEIFRPMYSVMDLVDVWTGRYWPHWPVQLLALAFLLLPIVIRRNRWTNPQWQMRLLCSVLVFCVAFNHGAESPSFVIATTGVAIWWAATPRTRTHDVILLLTLLLSTVARSSLVPPPIRVQYFDASRAMVLPILAAFLVLQLELLRRVPHEPVIEL